MPEDMNIETAYTLSEAGGEEEEEEQSGRKRREVATAVRASAA